MVPGTLPGDGGTYALWLRLHERLALAVGRLGTCAFPAGEYVYVGSAFGPGGLRGRLGRHLRGGGNRHWHVDFLRARAELGGFWYAVTVEPLECCWVQGLAALPRAWIPVPGFGASDCRSRCPAHLVAFPPDGFSGEVLPAVAAITKVPILSLVGTVWEEPANMGGTGDPP